MSMRPPLRAPGPSSICGIEEGGQAGKRGVKGTRRCDPQPGQSPLAHALALILLLRLRVHLNTALQLRLGCSSCLYCAPSLNPRTGAGLPAASSATRQFLGPFL